MLLNELIAPVFAGLAGVGVVQSLAGSWLLRQQVRRPYRPPTALPPITVLKPLCGDEALLELALGSFCEQDYPAFQIVFGVQSPVDPAIETVRRLQRRFPALDLQLVVDATRNGRNNKVGNLRNMVGAARHDLLVISDSDIHAPPDTLRSVAAAVERPGVGLVTTLYTGLAANPTLAASLGTAQINHSFLPGALMARRLGRRDCLGAVMALRRDTLEQIGGLEALSEHLADDALLGQKVRDLGLDVALAGAIPATTVPETRLPALIAHEMRWMRTVKSVAPVGFVLGALQYPLFWATLMLLAGSDHAVYWAAFLFAWTARGYAAASIDRLLHLDARLPIWCLPFRDVLSVAIMAGSYRSNRVAWRGQELRVTSFSDAVLHAGKG